MARICADVRMVNNSGIGVYIRQYIRYMLTNTPNQIILLGRRAELAAHFGEFSSWQHIEADFPIYSVQEQLHLPRLIPACDVFWSPHYNIPLLPIRARRRLVTVPDVFHLAHLETFPFAQKVYARLVMNAAVRFSDRVTTISQFSAREIIRLTAVRSAKVRTIPLGLDTGLFRRVSDKSVQQRVRTKYSLPDKYILFVGNVKPNKNLRTLVDAFARILPKIPDCHLLIAGKKDGFITGDASLFEQISENPDLARRVSFSGYVDIDDLPVLYSMAAVFGFPSLYEGFGFPPLEAMACGCPVVASDRASIPEVSGDAALYADPTDAALFADALYRALTDESLQSVLVRKGYQQILKYDWTQSGQQFMAEIDTLLTT